MTTTIKQIIKGVQQSNRKDNKLFWAFPIASELHKLNCNLMILWGIKCLEIYLSELECAEANKLNKYLQRILVFEQNLTSLQCIKIGREVWDLPNRSNPQIAVARFWWALSDCKSEHSNAGIMEINSAITLLLPSMSNRSLLNKYTDAAIKIYEEYNLQSDRL